MTNKQLGTIALIGEPAMLIGVNVENIYSNLPDS